MMMQVETRRPDAPSTEGQGLGASYCEALLSQHLDSVVRVYGANGLGVISLPPLGKEPIIGAQVRVAAALYWCRELEEAGVLPFVEALVGGVVDGTLEFPIGDAAVTIMRMWRERDEQFTAKERALVYQRVFGSSARGDGETDRALENLALVLTEIGRARKDRGVLHLKTRAGQIGTMLAAELSARSAGIAAFAARDIIRQVREGIRLLSDQKLALAMGGGAWRQIIERFGERLLNRPIRLSEHIARAKSGARILGCLAGMVPDIMGAMQGMNRNHPMIREAEVFAISSGERR